MVAGGQFRRTRGADIDEASDHLDEIAANGSFAASRIGGTALWSVVKSDFAAY